ncbi:hypothetical protein HWV62_33503 [Athelia sp. TMB]|nr:hypothetical protein HWV62_33503 [Athelia sp. TMB]
MPSAQISLPDNEKSSEYLSSIALDIKHIKSFYSASQVLEYLRLIQFTPLPVLNDAHDGLHGFEPTLNNLETLSVLSILFAQELTALPSNMAHELIILPQGLFNRMVRAGRGFGAVCMGQNFLLLGIMRGLGYRVYPTATRFNLNWPSTQRVELEPLGHPLLITQVADCASPFIVDVGFDAIRSSARFLPPMPLDPSAVVTSSQYRLFPAPLPMSSLFSHAAQPQGWFLQTRAAPGDGWSSAYHFTLVEYTLDDLENIFFAYTRNRHVIMMQIYCTKIRALPTGEFECLQIRGDQIVRRIGGRKEVLKTFKWEDERVDAIRQLFGIDLESDALENMKGMKIALPRKPLLERSRLYANVKLGERGGFWTWSVPSHLRPLCLLAVKVACARPVTVTILVSNVGTIYAKINAELARCREVEGVMKGTIRVATVGAHTSDTTQGLYSDIASFEQMWEDIITGSGITCSSSGATLPPASPPSLLLLDGFQYTWLGVVRSSPSPPRVFQWSGQFTAAFLRTSGPASLGGTGDIIRSFSADNPDTDELVQVQDDLGGVDVVVHVPGMPGMYKWEYMPQVVGVELFDTSVDFLQSKFLEEADGLVTRRALAADGDTMMTALSSWVNETRDRPTFHLGPLMPFEPASCTFSQTSLKAEMDAAPGDIGEQTLKFLDNALEKFGQHSVVYISFGTIVWFEAFYFVYSTLL